MLNAMRKNTKIIIWSVILSFILWGGYSVGTTFRKEGRVAGEIFGKGVHFQEYNRFYRASQRFTFTGDALDDPDMIRRQTWQNLIYAREGKRLKIEVSDDEVRSEIKRIFAAQGVENLTPELYENFLENALRETPREFEKQVREMIRIQKLIQSVFTDEEILPTEEAIQERTLLNIAEAEVEVVRFEALDDAIAFYEDVHDQPSEWQSEIESIENLPSARTTTDSLLNLMREWRISKKDILALHGQTPGTISNPIASGQGYLVILLNNKKETFETVMDDEQKAKYVEDLANENKQRRFIEWNMELMIRANLEDYLPTSEAANAPSM